MVLSYVLEKAQSRKGMRLLNTRTLASTDKKPTISQKGHAKNSGIYAIIKHILIRVTVLDLASAPLAKGIGISPAVNVSVRVVNSVAARHWAQSGYS